MIAENQNTGLKQKEYHAMKAAICIITPFISLLMPANAYAVEASNVGTTPTFSAMLDTIRNLVNTVALPIAIVMAGWKIIYLAIFPGLLGSDPFNQVPDGYSLQWDAIITLIKYHLTGFFKGILYIACFWAGFNIIIGIVSVLAQGLDGLF